MVVRETAPVGVDGELSSRGDRTPRDERPTLSFLAESQILQEQHGVYCESVVEHRHVDVRRSYPGHCVGPRPRLRCGRDRDVRHLAYVAVPVGLTGTQQVHGGFFEVPGPLGTSYDSGSAAVGDQATVTDAQGRGDHARGEHVICAEIFAHERFRVELRPPSGGDGDLGQLLARGAVLVDVTGCGQGVHANGVAGLVRCLVGVGLRACDEASPTRTLGRAVGYEGDLAEPRVYRSGGMKEVGDKRGAAHARRVRVTGSYTEILADREGRHVIVGREQAVHVGLDKAGVPKGAEGGLPDKIQGCEPWPNLAEVRLRDPDDGHLTPQAHRSSSLSTKTGTGSSPSRSTRSVTLAPTSTLSAGTSSTRLIILKPSSRSTRMTL